MDPVEAESRIQIGFALDRHYAHLMGRPQQDKESTILDVARILGEQGVPYAIMGGVAVQVHTEDPRTTLDLDIALKSRDDIPSAALAEAGFKHEGTFPFSDNWRAPGPGPRKHRIAVQFSVDDLTAWAVDHAGTFMLDRVEIPVVTETDLVRLKIAAAIEPRRRASKRISDYGDITRLLEEHPRIRDEIPDIDRRMAAIEDLIVRARQTPP